MVTQFGSKDMAFGVKTKHLRPVQLVASAVLAAGYLSSANAEAGATKWQVKPYLYLTGTTNYVKRARRSFVYYSIIPAAELRWTLPARRWYASMFAEYRISGDDRFSDITNLGTYWKYNLARWDVTAYLFVNVTPQSSQTLQYAGRLRYYLAANHKLGIEAAGAFAPSSRPAIAAGYYASVADTLTLKFVADPGINSGPDFAARMELVWEIR